MFDFSDPSWLNDANVFLLAGPATGALDALPAAMTANPETSYTVGAGLSPFSTIDLSFGGSGKSGMPYILANMTEAPPTELVLVMSLETEPSGATTLPWVPTCTAAAVTAAAKLNITH
jgi:hypothetical protein